MYIYLLTYPLLGAGLKYIDDAFDKKTFNKKFALILAPLLGILWVYTMFINQFSATILFAIMLGVALRGKIDNYAHLAGTLVIVAIIPFIGLSLMVIPLIFLATAAFLDEFGNDLVDNYLSKHENISFSKKFLKTFFDQRWMTKIAVLYVVLLGVFPIYFFLAIILFDLAYFSVKSYSNRQQTTAQPVKA